MGLEPSKSYSIRDGSGESWGFTCRSSVRLDLLVSSFSNGNIDSFPSISDHSQPGGACGKKPRISGTQKRGGFGTETETYKAIVGGEGNSLFVSRIHTAYIRCFVPYLHFSVYLKRLVSGWSSRCHPELESLKTSNPIVAFKEMLGIPMFSM